MVPTIILSVVVFLLGAALMGLGLLFQRETSCMQRGTCGGTPIEVGGVKMTCSTCPNRDKPGYSVGPTECETTSADTT